MFIGHFGVGFGAKSLAPNASLGTLLLAAQFVDLLWPTLLLLGVERVYIAPGIIWVTPLDFVSYPYTHSLLMILLWGLLLGAGFSDHNLPGQCLRSRAAQYAGHRLGQSAAMAAGSLGLLDRP